MTNCYINLFDLISIFDFEELRKKYVRCLCGLPPEQQIRCDELNCVESLINELKLERTSLNNFLYGYNVPHLSKEFDLVKASKEKCVNIELKSGNISEDRIKKQLEDNRHYLKLISDCVFSFTYVKETNKLYELENDNLVESNFFKLKSVLNEFKGERLDFDTFFNAKNILVSPLNNPEKFVQGLYILTDQQQDFKKQIINSITDKKVGCFFGLTGRAGTGKTLLAYDIAKELSQTKKVLVIHSGIKCAGHNYLQNKLNNTKIIEAKELRFREIKDCDVIIVDEAHRLYLSILEKIRRWTIKGQANCLFSFDPEQKMSNTENLRGTDKEIMSLCGGNIYSLTGKIRTNKNISSFIKCLFNLNERSDGCNFDDIKILYEENDKKAVKRASELTSEGYTYIAYTPSSINPSLDYQDFGLNTHKVIGQEYDSVVMVLNSNFIYENNKLHALKHPNPDYIFPKLLFQGLTRARERICLIVTKESLLEPILKIKMTK